jgi:uncharacterized membrane protein YjjP (DUF1212 family)
MPCVYANTHSTSLMRFITKEDMNALIEINHIIRDICSNKLHIQYKERLETNIV